MKFPKRVEAALREHDPAARLGVLATGDLECEGAKFHSPNPLVLIPVEVGDSRPLLCGTCAANLSVLRFLLRQTDGDLPWAVRREFGNMIRALAMSEWSTDDESDEVAGV